MPTRSSLLLLALCAGCAAQIDRFTERRVLTTALKAPDLGKACAMGESLGHALAAVPPEKHPPHHAMIVAEATAGVCEQEAAWEAELDALRASRQVALFGTAEARDARLRADRAHVAAGARFHRAWSHLVARYGVPEEGACPRIKERDEVPYLLGVISGVLAVIHDRKGGGSAVPVDIVLAAGRGGVCLDNETWWHVPAALQAGAWATIPGSGPAGVDPWAVLEAEAVAGEPTGVRVARALQVFIASNAGRSDLVAHGISALAGSLSSVEQDPEWALLDEYGRVIALHESDLVWTAAEGHRTPRLGDLPGDDAAPEPDPFGSDPFGEDPFAEPVPPGSPVEQTQENTE